MTESELNKLLDVWSKLAVVTIWVWVLAFLVAVITQHWIAGSIFVVTFISWIILLVKSKLFIR